jgi:ABC-type lipoprotein release transport system permease subunit
MLFGLKPNAPATFAGAVALLAAVALAASYVPARRASRVEPVQAVSED